MNSKLASDTKLDSVSKGNTIKHKTDFCLHLYQNLWATGVYTQTYFVQSTAMQKEGLIIIYAYKANCLFKTSIYLLEGVKVGKAVMYIFSYMIFFEFNYIK